MTNKGAVVGLRVLSMVIGVAVVSAGLVNGFAAVPPHVKQAADLGRPIWVFLSDKGPSEYAAKLTATQFMSARAVRRLALRGGVYPREQDWPVYAEYGNALREAGLAIRVESRLLNAVSGHASSSVIEQIAQFAFVDSFRVVRSYRRSIPEPVDTRPAYKPTTPPLPPVFDYGAARPQIEALQIDRVHDAGFDGTGVFLCFLDTGFDINHPAFDSLRLVATYDFINDDVDVDDDDALQMDHGTATLSVCAALHPGSMVGVAPRADYALGKTEDRSQEQPIEEDFWVEGAEWADTIGCDIISSSVGYSDWYDYGDLDGNTAVTTVAADRLAARGLLIVNSAGNEGNKPWRYVVAPSDGDSVLAVGATTVSGIRTSFSSVGPTADDRIKPDVMAPGSGVVGANLGLIPYAGKTGTSFSAPLVAGVCALMLQQDSSLTPWQVIERLRETATMANDPDTLMGWGVVQAAEAMRIPKVVSESGIRVYPNPSSTGQISIVTPDTAGTSEYQVFTVSGQNVRAGQFDGSLGRWDGRTSDGRPVASGIYLIRVVTPVREEILKVAILRDR
ncbi:MAG: S8 family serine peptidase [candidate division Zixibacteria bacterium]|nr:S8 family serine peptidase [candidate division Zixibacteria bacterium]